METMFGISGFVVFSASLSVSAHVVEGGAAAFEIALINRGKDIPVIRAAANTLNVGGER